MELKLSKRYEPLFEWLEGNHPQVDTVVITGGRYSQKSFAVGSFLAVAAKDYNHRILYTRYTLMSAEDSIIPEFNEKIDMLNAHDSFEVTRDRIRGVDNKSKIVFKGIKTSSGNQTANLKSLKDFSMFVLEEAEEMPDFDGWDKIKKSIRANDVQNLNILILNPTTKTHWIYDEFFESRGINEGWNGIHENVMYIHTMYLNMEREYITDNHFADFEDKREAFEIWDKLPKDEKNKDPRLAKKARYFKHVIKGGWLDKSEGVIFENWELGQFVDTGYVRFGMDFGYSNDPTTLVKVGVDDKRKIIYLKEELYKTHLVTSAISSILNSVCGDIPVIADSAEPRLIEELGKAGINIEASIKGPDSIRAGIALLQDYILVVHPSSVNLIKELNNYSWSDKKSKTPIDAHNHLIDAVRYSVEYLMGHGWEFSIQ